MVGQNLLVWRLLEAARKIIIEGLAIDADFVCTAPKNMTVICCVVGKINRIHNRIVAFNRALQATAGGKA